METIEVIRKLCKKNNVSISKLEKELGYGNGSLGKAKNIPSDRIKAIAEYFDVSMEYLMTGEDMDKYSDDTTHLYAKIRNNEKMKKMLKRYYELSKEQQNEVDKYMDFIIDNFYDKN